MKFSIEDFLSKCDQIRRKLRIWSHLLKKSLMENFIFLCNECCLYSWTSVERQLSHFWYFFGWMSDSLAPWFTWFNSKYVKCVPEFVIIFYASEKTKRFDNNDILLQRMKTRMYFMCLSSWCFEQIRMFVCFYHNTYSLRVNLHSVIA